MSRQEMLAAVDKAVQEDTRLTQVDVPEMGTFFLRIPSVAETEKIQAADQAARDEAAKLAQMHPWAATAARLLCDENGERLYDARNAEDLKKLASLGVDRLMKMTNSFNRADEGNSQGANS